MAHENDDNGLIRRYLLAQLEEGELLQVEERIMADTEFFNRVLLAEDEMIEQYVQRELSESDRERFKVSFLSTPEGKRQVSIVEALHERPRSEDPSPVPHQEEPKQDEPKPIKPRPNGIKTFAPGSNGGGTTLAEPVSPKSPQVSGEPQPVWWRQPALKWAATAVLVLAVGLGGLRTYQYIQTPRTSKGLASLRDAYREQRPTEARITDLNYAPPPPTTRGSAPEKFDYVALDRAKILIQVEANEHPSAQTYHDLGRLYLAEHEYDKAIDQFDKALKLDEKKAQLHSDLGAALLEKGSASQSKGELGKSFEEFGGSNEHLSKALELDASLLEALFNRALCHQYMRLYNLAEQDWNAYIEKDAKSRWADEARQKLKDLAARTPQTSQNNEQLFQDFYDAYEGRDDDRAWSLICQTRDAKGSLIANKLIDNYLDLVLKRRDAEADESLKVLSFAADLENRRAEDRFLPDLVSFYKAAKLTQLKEVAQARRLVKSGLESFYSPKPNFQEAMRLYGEAEEKFKRAGDTCEAMYIPYVIGNCYLQQWNAQAAIPLFETLSQACEANHYPWLQALSLVGIANANHFLSDFSAAISNTTRSLKLSESMADRIGFTRTLFQLADEYRFVNNLAKALHLHVEDLALAHAYLPQPRQLWKNYFSIARTFDQLELCAAAIDFQTEALQLAKQADVTQFTCRSYNYLGMTFARCGNYVEAKKNIERAIEIGESFSDRRVRVETVANSSLQLGYVYRKLGDFASAIEAYDQAITSYGELESTPFSYAARKGKLFCCIERGDCAELEQELDAVLNLFEQHRSKILEESNRNTYFDTEQSIYDVAIEFEYVNKGNWKKAFDYSERSRARSLRDFITTSISTVGGAQNPDIAFNAVSQPLSIDDIQELIPRKTQILQYAVLKDSLLIWVFSRDKDSLFTKRQNISSASFNERVRKYLQMISAAGTRTEELSSEAAYFYDLLIKPVEGWLDQQKQLCIVPDKILNYLPFGALLSPVSGKYFIEEHCFELSSSTNMFVLCSDQALKKETRKSERLLCVGAPLFDRAMFPKFDDLQSARREANTIASYYGPRAPLIGASATRRQVLTEMEASDVIHLATHAIAESNPMRSKLLLARDPAETNGNNADGILQAYEIYKLHLERVRLVVLSACQTGAESYYGGEGIMSLSRPFIARRVPLVVASLWPVESGSTADLMIGFHDYRKNKNRPTAQALRSAQIDMLRDKESNYRSPYYWAAFVTIGGYASY